MMKLMHQGHLRAQLWQLVLLVRHFTMGFGLMMDGMFIVF